jgi:PAS domain S-box-containing protein
MSADALREENRALRERIEELERQAAERGDAVARALLEHAPMFLTAITPEGRFLATGRPSEAFGSVVGRTVWEFAPADQHQLMRDAYARACASRQPQTYESIGYGENGEPDHTYLVRVVPLVEGDTVSVLVIIPTDITERVRLARSLSLSEQKLRLAVDSTHIGLWSWDLSRNVIVWDRRVLDIFGTAQAPGDYESYLAHVHPEDRSFVRESVARAREATERSTFEHRLVPRADGLERWVMCSGTMLRDEAGTPVLFMGGVLETTAQKHAAAQLQRAQRVEALGQLSAGLAHNFNNLLGVIIPNLELALAEPEEPNAREETLVAALGAATQARDLIKRLMTVTAPREAAPGACDLRAVVERAVALCRASFPREIELTVAVAPEVGHARMSSSDLEQIVLNLLFNARDALEGVTGRARRIEVTVDRAGGGDLHVRVRDNGIGMPPAIAARVFEPFFTTKPSHRGAGLGLADALVRVRDAEGRLDCQSAAGEGTTFTVTLPPAAPAPASTTAPTTPVARRAGGELILIVDDEPAVRAAVGRLLTRQGYSVLEANDAREARAVLRERGGEVRLVLLDQSMPHESGPEALPSLRALCAAPIAMFTGGMGELPPGAAAMLEKPAQTAELLRVVEKLIRG